jgi:pimeloyl-ACP methyl ester carboxylesterase
LHAAQYLFYDTGPALLHSRFSPLPHSALTGEMAALDVNLGLCSDTFCRKYHRSMSSSANDPPPAERPDHLVVLIHGINTRALWMANVAPTLRSAGLLVAPTSFGRFSIFRFLIPFELARRRAIRRVTSDIRSALQIYGPTKVSVIAHSFGTYVFAKILQREKDLLWHRVIFCGSVVREDFPLDRLVHQFQHPLLNEIGTKDIWPAVAEVATWGYGSVGSTGFNRPPVETRWHNGLKHSDFLTGDFCRRYWVPFLRDGTILPSAAPSSVPWPLSAILRLPIRWIVLGLILFGAFECYHFFGNPR